MANNEFSEIKRKTPLTEEEEFDEVLDQYRLEFLNKTQKDDNKKEMDKIKNILMKKFDVVIVPGPNAKKMKSKMRELKASKIGSLVNIRAVVVRVSEVQP